ncbi:hypothetical protein V8F33_002462 [Rhypophila sp. PSN 637]
MKTSTLLVTSLVGALAAYYWGEFVYRTMTVMGVFRWQVPNMYADEDIVYIEDTQHCEDVHHHDGLLYTACEDNLDGRFKWFPPLGTFTEPELASKSKGSIHVVDPKTKQSKRLKFQNFDHITGFITHGFDIVADPDQPEGKAIYLIAINHLPNPQWTATTTDPSIHKARSQLEVFHHEIGSDTIRYVRSIWNDLIRTPNDVYAHSPTTIFVSNDHYHREGIKRALEDINFNAKYTEVIKLEVEPETLKSSEIINSADRVQASIALPHMHISNGMGHGRTDREILIANCASGILKIGQVDDNGNVTLTDEIRAEIVIDNPSYFSDPYSDAPKKGGFLLPGVAQPLTLGHTSHDSSYEGAKDSVMVWYATPSKTEEKKWDQRLIFSDDGRRLRSISGAVMVPIDPEEQEDKTKRQAMLFMTGFVSRSMIAVEVDL